MKKYRLIHQNSNIEAPEGRFDIGRSTECNLVLDDPSVSRVHATIVNENDELFVEDRGSRNGCLVNGVRVVDRQKLRDGDRVAVGHQTIRVVAVERLPDADRTLGLATCSACGAWIASTDESCPRCGAPREGAGRQPGRATTEIIVEELALSQKQARPLTVVTTLVRKAIGMDRFEEAERLLVNLMDSTVKRREGGQTVAEDEINEINRAAAALAEAARAPRMVSRLFTFHLALGMLMPRETVETLYELVRKVGSRSCPEMSRYLAYLESRASRFSPGEKFIHRRLKGLLGLCS
jgi:predicted component of type VI protein secretion system